MSLCLNLKVESFLHITKTILTILRSKENDLADTFVKGSALWPFSKSKKTKVNND